MPGGGPPDAKGQVPDAMFAADGRSLTGPVFAVDYRREVTSTRPEVL